LHCPCQMKRLWVQPWLLRLNGTSFPYQTLSLFLQKRFRALMVPFWSSFTAFSGKASTVFYYTLQRMSSVCSTAEVTP
jgi:hypothetical protein